jgi:hypothetical protein
MQNFNFQPHIASEIAKIDWEKLSIEEIMAILDRLGIGFMETLKLLLLKLRPGQKAYLMNLVQTTGVGNKSKHSKTNAAISSLKKDPRVPKLVLHILNLLTWRADRKNGLTTTGSFGALPQQNYQPAFVS